MKWPQTSRTSAGNWLGKAARQRMRRGKVPSRAGGRECPVMMMLGRNLPYTAIT
jgi:hypothetical protein